MRPRKQDAKNIEKYTGRRPRPRNLSTQQTVSELPLSGTVLDNGDYQ
jgi:hypothetical protein